MKKQILFVDDECNVLEGLRRMLRPQRNDWDMQFVMSGAEALKIMDARPIDLLITDMRMPEMDGAVLLTLTMERHPDVIRIILSGQADSDLIMKALGVAHQFIPKPCEPDSLKLIIQRAMELRTLMNDRDIGNGCDSQRSLSLYGGDEGTAIPGALRP
jgi:DNA-binding NtrC family response regulator